MSLSRYVIYDTIVRGFTIQYDVYGSQRPGLHWGCGLTLAELAAVPTVGGDLPCMLPQPSRGWAWCCVAGGRIFRQIRVSAENRS